MKRNPDRGRGAAAVGLALLLLAAGGGGGGRDSAGADAAARGLAGPATFTPAARAAELARRAGQDLLQEPELAASGMTDVELANGLVVWTMLVGAVSAEVFEQLGAETISDAGAFFEYQVATAASVLFGPDR